MGKVANYPTAKVQELDGLPYTGETVRSLRELASSAPPQTTQELRKRIDDYFSFCAARDLRPGVESLCLALHTTRQNFWKWCNGQGGKEKAWQEACQDARQAVISFIECAAMSGHLSPPVWIFAAKNWAGYADQAVIEHISTATDTPQAIEDLPSAASFDLLEKATKKID